MPFLPVSAYIFGLFFSAEAKKRVDGGEQIGFQAETGTRICGKKMT
jgi:hypothetical protein